MYCLGTVTSSSSEREAGILGSERELPILDMIKAIVVRMSNGIFYRGKETHGIVNKNKTLTPYEVRQHTAEVSASGNLYVEKSARKWSTSMCCSSYAHVCVF